MSSRKFTFLLLLLVGVVACAPALANVGPVTAAILNMELWAEDF